MGPKCERKADAKIALKQFCTSILTLAPKVTLKQILQDRQKQFLLQPVLHRCTDFNLKHLKVL